MFARLKAFLGSHSHSQSHHGYKGHLFQEDLQHIHSTLNEAAVFNASLRQMAADADKAAAALDVWQASATALAQSPDTPRQYITTTRQDKTGGMAVGGHLTSVGEHGDVPDAGKAEREVMAGATPTAATGTAMADTTTSTTSTSITPATSTPATETAATTHTGIAPAEQQAALDSTTTATATDATTLPTDSTTTTTGGDTPTATTTCPSPPAGTDVDAQPISAEGGGVSGVGGTTLTGVDPEVAAHTVAQAGAVTSSEDRDSVHVTVPAMVPVEEPHNPVVTALVAGLGREVGHGVEIGDFLREQLVETSGVYGKVLEVAQARLSYLKKHPATVPGVTTVAVAGEEGPAEELAKLQAAAVWLVKAAQGLRGLVASSLLAGLQAAGNHSVPMGVMPELSAHLLVMPPSASRRKGRHHGLSPASPAAATSSSVPTPAATTTDRSNAAADAGTGTTTTTTSPPVDIISGEGAVAEDAAAAGTPSVDNASAATASVPTTVPASVVCTTVPVAPDKQGGADEPAEMAATVVK